MSDTQVGYLAIGCVLVVIAWFIGLIACVNMMDTGWTLSRTITTIEAESLPVIGAIICFVGAIISD